MSIFVNHAVQATSLDPTILQARREEEQQFVGEMRDLFNLADSDGSGTMDVGELEEFVGSKSVRIRLQMMGLDVQADLASRLFKVLDQDHTGELDIHEFAEGCL